MENQVVLSIENLKTYFFTRSGTTRAVDGINLRINKGEMVGLVGESGCGKSVTLKSIVRLVPEPGRIVDGAIWFQGENLLEKGEEDLRKIRGKSIAMIFQDPLSALNPVYTIKKQLEEMYLLHQRRVDRAAVCRQMIGLLKKVQLPEPESQINAYPHQFSGGMRQRILIALAISLNPSLILADEPTTALDVTVQKQILNLLDDLRREFSLSILYISHDINLILERCERVYVMYAGHLVEEAPAERLLLNPRHPYTSGLINSIPSIDAPTRTLNQIGGEVPSLINLPTGCPYHPRCDRAETVCREALPALQEIGQGHYCRCHFPGGEGLRVKRVERNLDHVDLGKSSSEREDLLRVEDLKVRFELTKGLIDKIFSGGGTKCVKAVDGVNLIVRKEETLGLIGESGCGKTTTGRAITLLTEPDEGRLYFENLDLLRLSQEQYRAFRKKTQFIFQDPFSSLNPRMTVRRILERPIEIYEKLDSRERRDKIIELLNQVGLNKECLDKYPHEFSGGQRQRICIARALSTDPIFMVADEPTSALDVSIQAQILNLLTRLRERFHLSLLLITHNLAVVRYVSDRIAVMYLGKIVEEGSTRSVFDHPLNPYTKLLLSAVPSPYRKRKGSALNGEIASTGGSIQGCRFYPRCSLRKARCRDEEPALIDGGGHHLVACHLYGGA